MPIIPPEQPLDTSSEDVVEIIRGINRNRKYGSNMCLSSMVAPYPTIDGIQGKNSRRDTQWITDFHRNGYIGLSYLNKNIDDSGKYFLTKDFYNLFKAFFDICENILNVVSFDSPYVIRNKYLNAAGTILVRGGYYSHTKTAYKKQNIIWSEIIKQTGDPFLPIADIFIEQMFHAFGLYRYEM